MLSKRFLPLFAIVCTFTFATRAADPPASVPSTPSVDVILWFDTEDYLLPADDDATKRLCEMLTERGIHATFKIVGEKARTLERRGRHDVIDALKKHTIGYHANFHSVHPAPTEYLADCGWLEGIEEFLRREGPGAADVRRILGVPTLACYGQPGSSWGPQAAAALRRIGIAPHGVPCYLDEGDQVGFNGQPFWYSGTLHVFHMAPNYTRMDLHDPGAVEPAEKKVSEIAERLRAQGGGLISIFYHPCEWVHREFWDGVNFSRGANPPREQWKAPPQLPAEETEAAFQRFGQYIDHIRSIPGVHWITASDLPFRYPDAVRGEGATAADLTELATRIQANPAALNIQKIGNKVFSVADQFETLTLALNVSLTNRAVNFPLRARGLIGPASFPPESSARTNVDWFALRDALRDTEDFLKKEQRVPSRVFIGADPVAPADFLVGVASAWILQQQGQLHTNSIFALGHGAKILPEDHIAKDTPGLFGGWIIHKANFRAPKLLELGKLQAWTLKPAVRHAD
jgi:hypothetical protein